MFKLVVCVMGQNCERFIDMCLESITDADAIVYCDGGSTDQFKQYFEERRISLGLDIDWIENIYDQEDKGMNGKQRNFYLKHLKENYPDYWALCLDADEVVEDLSKIKEFIQEAGDALFSVKMRHLIQDLSHEDATVKKHFVPNRLFKIEFADKYPEVEHPVLQPKYQQEPIYNTECTTIWHLAYIPNLWEIKKRYDNHMKKSNIHTPEYLKQWYYSHLFGTYPKSQFNPVELPKIILEKFGIDKDELYFANRGLEHKHWIDSYNWKEFFKCKTATEFGCGRGPRVLTMNALGIDTNGLEISEYAVNNKMHTKIIRCDVTNSYDINPVDLVIAYDLLEHISYDKIDHTINNIIKSTNNHILVSVPVIGDPNLEADPTHIIKETKEWWINKFTSKGLKEVKVPDHFLFKDQIMIFEKRKHL